MSTGYANCLVFPILARPVVAEVPEVIFGIARHVSPCTVVLGRQFAHDVRSCGDGDLVMRVRIRNKYGHRVRLTRHCPRAHASIFRLGRADHHDAGADAQFGVFDAVALARDNKALRESERPAEPIDRTRGVVVGQAGIDVRWA